MDEFEPIAISEIGDSFLSLGTLEFYTCHSLNEMKNDDILRGLLYKDRDFGDDDYGLKNL